MLALPGRLNATVGELQILNEYATGAAREGMPEKYSQLIASKGGIQVGRLKMTVGLEGRRQQTVRVVDVRAVILTRDEPLTGTLLCAPPEGADVTEKMLFNLDRPVPVAQLVDENGEANSRYFSQRTISLTRNERVTLDLTFDLTVTYTEWVIELDVVYGDVHETIRVDNLGGPFRLTGYGGGKPPGSYNGLRHYSEAYIVPVGASEPLKKIDPKTAKPEPNEDENAVFCPNGIS